MTDELRDLDRECQRITGDPLLRRFSTDPAAARLLEDEIERRALWERYILALARICEVERTFTAAWALLRATPEQKARAFMQAAS